MEVWRIVGDEALYFTLYSFLKNRDIAAGQQAARWVENYSNNFLIYEHCASYIGHSLKLMNADVLQYLYDIYPLSHGDIARRRVMETGLDVISDRLLLTSMEKVRRAQFLY